MLARVGQLPEGTQRVLGAAAVAGARFGQPLLEAATGLTEAALSDALRPAVAAGVLVTDDDVLAFRHALIREAVLAGQLPGERNRWHATLARALEADHGLAPGTRAAAEIARHWDAAGEAARALPAAWRAAADAAGALAYAEQPARRLARRPLRVGGQPGPPSWPWLRPVWTSPVPWVVPSPSWPS